MSNNVQVENGNYARIHNEILEHLAQTNLSGSEFRCLLFLLRKTYGWGQKDDKISYSQFAEGTGLLRRNVIKTMNNLIDRSIVVCKANGSNRPQTWGFNKYFERWDSKTSVQNDTSLPQTSVQNDTTSSVQNDTSLPQTSVQNDTKTSVQNDTHKRYKERERIDTDKQDASPSARRRGIVTHFDPRQLADGLLPVGTGKTAIQIWRESFAWTPTAAQIRDMNEKATDLDRWRTITAQCAVKGFRSYGNVMDVYLNGFHNGNVPTPTAPQRVNINLASV